VRTFICVALVSAVVVPGPRAALAQCPDADGDALCDVADPCLSSVPAPFDAIKEPTLTLRGLDEPRGGQRFRLKGVVLVPDVTAVDPAANGIRVMLREWSGDATFVDALVAGGAGWVAHAGERWTYRDPIGQAGGVTRVRIRRVPPPAVPAYANPRAAYAIDVEARDVALALAGVLEATVSLDGTARNGRQCGDALFADALPWRCTVGGYGRAARCGSARRVGPCRVSDPNDMVVCAALKAAAAEDAYFAETGSYFAGPCANMPRYVATPGVTCTAVVTTNGDGTPGFTLATTHAQASWSCAWFSGPGPGVANPSCY
jgi:hypothetical protein